MVVKSLFYLQSGPSGLAATGNQSGLPTTGKHASYYLVAARLIIVGAKSKSGPVSVPGNAYVLINQQ
jgi:hypothetical protein